MKFLRKVPMFGFLLVVYDILIVIGKTDVMGDALLRLKMMSGASWLRDSTFLPPSS